MENPQEMDGATFLSRRLLHHPPERVFEAFARPEVLSRWWGPEGFSSTFDEFEFRPGGRWEFVMNGSNGSNYPNESVILVLDAPSTLVFDHASPPRFRLTVTLAPHDAGTVINWLQEFEDTAAASA